MTAFSRLWRRASIWRRCVIATGIAAGLMFLDPPEWTGAPERPTLLTAPATPNPVVSLPGPAPQTAPPPMASGFPVPGDIYVGRLPFGTQSVPLPAGKWLMLAEATGPSTTGGTAVSAFLAFILGGRLVAAAAVTGSAEPDPRAMGFAPPLEAQIPAFYYRRVFASVDHGPLDLWVCGSTQTAKWSDPVRQAALRTIQQQNLEASARFDSVVYRFADQRTWLSVEFMFPASAETEPPRGWIESASLADPVGLSRIEKVRRWGKAWHDVMQQAFAGAPPSANEGRIAMP
jgi:hypothetical protein